MRVVIEKKNLTDKKDCSEKQKRYHPYLSVPYSPKCCYCSSILEEEFYSINIPEHDLKFDDICSGCYSAKEKVIPELLRLESFKMKNYLNQISAKFNEVFNDNRNLINANLDGKFDYE